MCAATATVGPPHAAMTAGASHADGHTRQTVRCACGSPAMKARLYARQRAEYELKGSPEALVRMLQFVTL